MRNKSLSTIYRISAVMVSAVIVFIAYGTDFGGEQINYKTPSGIQNGIKPLASAINSVKNSGKAFPEKKLFTVSDNPQTLSLLNGYLKSYTALNIDNASKDRLLKSREENIMLEIPVSSGKKIELELMRVNVTENNFKTGTLSGNGTVTYVDYTPGLYYRGIIKGDNSSFASFSIFDDFVMAVISDKNGNWNLSSLKGQKSLYSDNYVFYNDAEMLISSDFTCGVNDELKKFEKKYINQGQNGQNPGNDNFVPKIVKKYFECDYKMYQD
ncbi:MAG: hypothetical protein L0Y76_12275, partial [Ignavibacteria bacterium]|nr:hypothetical protein [Ignavibacteria bacterium]